MTKQPRKGVAHATVARIEVGVANAAGNQAQANLARPWIIDGDLLQAGRCARLPRNDTCRSDRRHELHANRPGRESRGG